MPSTLKGITVVDLTQNIAGPYCTQLLGDFGATVIKIERPGTGDDVRRFAPAWNGEGTAYLGYNRNKKSVCVNLDAPRGQEIVRRLAANADLFVESMKPGSVDARGLGYDKLSALNPRLIYASVSGFGDQGPMRDLPGYDPLGQAYSGIMSITGHPGNPPARVVVPIIDMGTGMWLFIGILAAVMEREKTGKGSRVTGSLLETGIAWVMFFLSNYLATGEIPERTGSATPAAAPYEAFHAADGWVMVAAGNDRLYANFCGALGLSDLAKDPRFDANSKRTQRRAELHELLEARTRRYESEKLIDLLRQAGVPCSPINTIDKLIGDEQVATLGIIKNAPQGFRIPGFKLVDLPIRLNGERANLERMPPRLGEHTVEVLRDAGYADDEIERLKADKAVA